MGNITDQILKIQELTNTNLKILRAINESLSTKKEHLSVEVGGTQYVIPSIICLENKINTLQADFENIVDIPKSGNALIYLDGNTQKLQLQGYSNTPDPIETHEVSTFMISKNEVLKDFMTPTPFVRLSVNSIPDNIKTVNVKKVSILNTNLLNTINSITTDKHINYGDLLRVLDGYKEGIDFKDYNTIKRLPIREGAPLGKYTIKKILNHFLDKSLEEHYKLELNESLTYMDSNETREGTLSIGDTLLANNDRVKLLIEEVNTTNRTLTVKVLYGSYTDLQDISGQEQHYTLRFFRPGNYDDYKYIDVPLEEDSNIVVFLSAINDDLNTQSPWGTGIYIKTDELTVDIDGKIYNFTDYYKTYVNNLGDSLFGICKMINNTLTNTSKEYYNSIINYKPVIPKTNYIVTKINKHLDNSQTVQSIKKLYNQKSKYKEDLDAINNTIDNINKLLSELSFDDTSNNRTIYEGQLRDSIEKKSELMNSIVTTSKEISVQANNTELPIENSKYHIRGFVESTIENLPKPIKIDVEYRYKSKNTFNGNAITINDEFIYSDWNRMESLTDIRYPKWDDNINDFTFVWEDDSTNKNVPSWNQIDIPISQGESVDFKVRYIFDLGYPFVKTYSKWSDITTVEFPTEYLTNVEILNIIDENNDDVRNFNFDAKLKKDGVYTHINDSLTDNELLYLHKPESISSGFYTNDNHIISLSEKLGTMDFDINELKSEVYGVSNEDLVISISDNEATMVLRPYVDNVFDVIDYKSNPNKINLTKTNGTETVNVIEDCAYSQLTLTIYNGGEYNAKLFTLFPGPYNNILTKEAPSRFNGDDYTDCTFSGGFADYSKGIWMQTDPLIDSSRLQKTCSCNCGCDDCNCTPDLKIATPQHYNQYIYFRYKDIYTNTPYYRNGNEIFDVYDSNTLNTSTAIPEAWNYGSPVTATENGEYFSTLFPYIGVISNICIDNGDTYKVLKPGESVNIPISFYYYIKETTNNAGADFVSKRLAFEIRTSLYKDPIVYRITVNAGNNARIYSKVKRESGYVGSKYSTTIVRNAANSSRKSNKSKTGLQTKGRR